MIIITTEILQQQSNKIIKFLRESGGIFGDSNITTEQNIIESMSHSLPDIAQYCKNYGIEITELDTIKLLVFAMPYLKKSDKSMNMERYIASIFKLLENAYKVKFTDKQQIKNSIKVCNNLFYDEQNMIVYGYIKGFQESLQYCDKTRSN